MELSIENVEILIKAQYVGDNVAIQTLITLHNHPSLIPICISLLQSSRDNTVLFWTANSLMTRIKKDAKMLHENLKDINSLKLLFNDFLFSFVKGERIINSALLGRMSSSLAYISMIHPDKETIKQTCSEAVNLLITSKQNGYNQGIQVALSILSNLAESVLSTRDAPLDYFGLHHTNFLQQVIDCSDIVIGSGSSILSSSYSIFNGDSSMLNMCDETLKMLMHWIEVAGGLISIFQSHTDLCSFLINCLLLDNICITSSSIIVSSVLKYSYPRATNRDAFISFLISGLLENFPKYLLCERNRQFDVCVNYTQAFSSVVEAEALLLASSPSSLPFFSTLLHLTSSSQAIGVHTIEAWLALQDVPTEERLPELAAPVYQNILVICVNLSAYNKDGEGDEIEGWTAFRKGPPGIRDLLISIFFLLQGDYFMILLDLIQSEKSTWMTIESALFCLSSIASDGKVFLLETEDPKGEKMKVRNALANFIGNIFSFSKHPKAIEAGVTFLGDYSKWINSFIESSPETLVVVMNYFLSSLSIKEAAESASKSIQIMCATCSKHLASFESLSTLISTLEDVVSKGLTLSQRVSVTEGISRIISTLEYKNIESVLSTLAFPMLSRIEQVVEKSPSTLNEMIINEEILSVAASTKYLNLQKDKIENHSIHPALFILEKSWPLIQRIMLHYNSSYDINSSLFKLFSSICLSVQQQNNMISYLGNMISRVIEIYKLQPIESGLAFISDAVEIFGKDAPTEFNEVLGIISLETFKRAQNNIHAQSEILSVYINLLNRYFIFCTDVLFRNVHFDTIFSLICVVSRGTERESSRGALRLLSQLLKISDASLSSCLDKAIMSYNVSEIYFQFLLDLSSSAPSFLVPFLSEALLLLSQRYERLISPIISDVVDALKIDDKFSIEEKDRLKKLLTTLPTSNKNKFKAMIKDFFSITHGLENSDTLLAYEL